MSGGKAGVPANRWMTRVLGLMDPPYVSTLFGDLHARHVAAFTRSPGLSRTRLTFKLHLFGLNNMSWHFCVQQWLQMVFVGGVRCDLDVGEV